MRKARQHGLADIDYRKPFLLFVGFGICLAEVLLIADLGKECRPAGNETVPEAVSQPPEYLLVLGNPRLGLNTTVKQEPGVVTLVVTIPPIPPTSDVFYRLRLVRATDCLKYACLVLNTLSAITFGSLELTPPEKPKTKMNNRCLSRCLFKGQSRPHLRENEDFQISFRFYLRPIY